MKRGKLLGGVKPPRRGRKTSTNGSRSPREHRPGSLQLVGVLVFACLIFGGVAAFGYMMDRQIRGGILAQRVEAAQRSDWVPLESLPAYVPQAFLIAVDPYFEQGGVIRARDARDTTIPRELVRQIHLLNGGIGSTARELVMAPILEQRASKEEILELYLNRVYLGSLDDYPIYGIYHAAVEYLGKRPEELTLSEATTLAGLLLEPRISAPSDRAGAVGIRRNEVLRALLISAQISQEEFSNAIRERLAFQPGLSELPMSRRIATAQDTTVIRLPIEAVPQTGAIADDPI